ncbi:helix-turn-helix domain-containing protein [Domibacillus sp.]|uniref:helix-turn-helix domain-containing protein n=1 Tax=Domibacillus sp. TaxID=1969783 RepID=UPI0028123439|nr:helix-turn-helix domain-containing protein [Domibacillus sp.]
MSIGESIRSFRLKKELSLTELASRCGITTSYISSVERGIQTNPSIGVLQKIARELDVPVHHLINHHGLPIEEELNEEWRTLAREAIQSGVSKEQFKAFLAFRKRQKIK